MAPLVPNKPRRLAGFYWAAHTPLPLHVSELPAQLEPVQQDSPGPPQWRHVPLPASLSHSACVALHQFSQQG
jgi:hypothetical protein